MKMNEWVTTKVNFIHAIASARIALSVAAEEIERMTGQKVNPTQLMNKLRVGKSRLYFNAEGAEMYVPLSLVSKEWKSPSVFTHWDVDPNRLIEETEFLETLSMPGTWVEAWEKQ